MRYVISSCLMGCNCKYSGGNNGDAALMDYMKQHEVLEVCPEVLGGLPIPRASAEIVGDKVMNMNQEDVSAAFYTGARIALEKTLAFAPDLVILQPRSPSCGKGMIYDGSFSKRLIPGDGIFVRLLKEAGIPVKTCEEFLADLSKQ